MRFTTLAFLATLATLGATSPIAEHSPAGVALPRAINKADFTEAELANFTEEELANADPETCCCCCKKPPCGTTDVDILDKLIDTTE